MKRWIPPILAAALVAVLALALLRGNPQDAGGPLVGKQAPNFTLTTLDGGTVSLASLKGRPVVVNFWASWCVPCREEAPLLRELAEKQSADGLAIVGIAFQDRENDAKAFKQEYGLAFPTALDPNSEIAIEYGVGGVPETFIIDPSGKIVRHFRIDLTQVRDEFTQELAKLGVRL